ncbi:MAG: recombinase family protein [Thermomicrobiales bacterium]|nr:recombinase family protein [Thermomicrobiales bacterium]
MTESARVVLYCRQSEMRPGESATNSLSIRSQEDRGRQWAASIGGTVVAVITDHDLRGADPERPGIRDLLGTIRSIRVDALWMFALSRLARDLILQLMICRELDKHVGRVHTDVEGDINDPFLRGIYGLMNEQATRQQSAHSKAAFARRARDGNFPTGRTPTGYVRPHRVTITRANGTSYERHTGEPEIDPEGAAFIRSLFQRFADGESLHRIASDLASQGPGPRGGTWTRKTLAKILQSPIYAGDIVHHGVVVAHNDRWQIVDRALWDRVQAKLNRLVIVRRGERDSWLEGMVSHACGGRMYYQRYTGRSAGHGGMFVCRSHGSAVGLCDHGRRIAGAKLLEAAVRAAVVADIGNRRTSADALAYARELAGGRDAVRARARIDKELADARARHRRYDERFGDGKLSAERMDEEDARLKAAESAYPAKLAALPAPPNVEAIDALSASLTRLSDYVPNMTGDEVRTLLDDLSASVVVSDAGVRLIYGIDPHEAVLTGGVRRLPKWGKGVRRSHT